MKHNSIWTQLHRVDDLKTEPFNPLDVQGVSRINKIPQHFVVFMEFGKAGLGFSQELNLVSHGVNKVLCS